MNQIAAAEIVSLDDEDALDTARAGAKAAVLARMRRAGFPVPDGVVVLAAALSAQLRATASEAELLAAPLDPDLRQALVDAGGELSAPLAVRSSGIDEDGAQASHAGQYDTVLNVRGADELVDAVRTCWASGLSAVVRSYRTSVGRDGDSPLAVLVQSMVEADAAGVAFTANPVTGARDEILVSAVPGLGEKLVSGEVTPDEWVVRDGAVTNTSDHHGALSADQVRQVAELAERVATEFGGPSDLEWAFSGDRLYLLQVRPITALADPEPEPVAIPVDPPPGFWLQESTHSPVPLLPMTRELLGDNNAALRAAFAEFGVLLDGLRLEIIGGWQYRGIVPLGGGRPDPATMRERLGRCVAAARADHVGTVLAQWDGELRETFLDRIDRLRSADLPALSTEDLAGHLAAARELHRDASAVHFRLVGAVSIALGELALLLTERLAWSTDQIFELFAGLSPESTKPAAAIRRLAELAESKLDGAADLTALRALSEQDSEFASAMATYRREYGCRSLHYELATPALGERPDLILSLVRDQLARPESRDTADPAATRAAAAERARSGLGDGDEVADDVADEVARFDHLLARAQRAYPVREDNEYPTISAPYALLRWAALEAGRRLVEDGRLAEQDHVFFAEAGEVLEALRDGTDLRAPVEHRRGEHQWALRNPGPPSYGTPTGPPPALDGLPAEARSVMGAFRWSMANVSGAPVSGNEAGAATVRGLPGAAGTYTGTVRVVLDEQGFDRIQAGDVLVCPSTSPVWSVVFPRIGALVTDTGGALSHAAIIAREYAIPATLATGNGTRTLVDGSTVTVDGTAGTVEVHADA